MRQFALNHANNPPSRGHVLPKNLAALVNWLLEDNFICLAPHNTLWSLAYDGEEYLGPCEANPILRPLQQVDLLNEDGNLANAHLGGRVIDFERI